MKKGFTLLEVLLTVVLLVSGWVALSQALSTGLFASGQNEAELIAVKLAQEKIEEVRNLSYAAIANEAKAVVSGYPAFQREVKITIPQANLKQIEVAVYWFSKATELNTSLITYVSAI